MGVNFIIPGLYEHYPLNFNLLKLMEEHPEYFYDDVKVSAVYGNFQFCIFDGGRIFSQYRHTTKEEIDMVVSTYNNVFQVPVRLVFTNTELEPKHYLNRFGNVVLQLCENSMNEIVVNNEQFEEYLRENYPSYSFISSTTKCLNTPNLFKEELDKQKYKMICLDYNLNKNQKLLDEIPPEARGQCEFLVNAICPPGCPNRKEHYKLNSLYSLSYGEPYSIQNCPISVCTLHPDLRFGKNNLTPEEIYEKYVPNGYNLFKLEGRTLSLMENASNYAYYMAKPEYRQLVVSLLLNNDTLSKSEYTLGYFVKYLQ